MQLYEGWVYIRSSHCGFLHCDCVKPVSKCDQAWAHTPYTPYYQEEWDDWKSHSSQRKHHIDTRWLQQHFHDVKLNFIDQISTLYFPFLGTKNEKSHCLSGNSGRCCVAYHHGLLTQLQWNYKAASWNQQSCRNKSTVVLSHTQTNVKIRKMHIIIINLLIIYVIHITHAWTW